METKANCDDDGDRKCFVATNQNSTFIPENGETNCKKVGVTLNTKSCCLICLTNVEFTSEQNSGVFAVQNLLKVLKVSSELSIALQSLSTKQKDENNKDTKKASSKTHLAAINGTLCEDCGDSLQSFLALQLKLEKIQLEMDYFLERISKRIFSSYADTNLIQDYSRRMTSDLESLSQLPVVDRLRKEIREKSSVVRYCPQPQVKVERLKASQLRKRIPISEDPLLKEPSEPLPVSSTATNTNVKEEYFRSEVNFEDTGDYEDASFEPSLPSPRLDHPTTTASLEADTTILTRTPRTKRYTFNSQTRKWKCLACPLEFTQQSNASLHYRSHHLLRRFKCDICHKDSFPRFDKLQRHKKKCNGTLKTHRYFTCKICRKKFKEKWECNAHMMDCPGKIKQENSLSDNMQTK